MRASTPPHLRLSSVPPSPPPTPPSARNISAASPAEFTTTISSYIDHIHPILPLLDRISDIPHIAGCSRQSCIDASSSSLRLPTRLPVVRPEPHPHMPSADDVALIQAVCAFTLA